METTCINLVAVTIGGNLALLCAWAAIGIARHLIRDFKKPVTGEQQ